MNYEQLLKQIEEVIKYPVTYETAFHKIAEIVRVCHESGSVIKTSDIGILPDEVLEQIFQSPALNKKDRNKISLVCKKWYLLVSSLPIRR